MPMLQAPQAPIMENRLGNDPLPASFSTKFPGFSPDRHRQNVSIQA